MINEKQREKKTTVQNRNIWGKHTEKLTLKMVNFDSNTVA